MHADIARIYDPIPQEAYRILVDRLWPRGFKKTTTKVNTWLKEVAPSDELRSCYQHDDSKAEEFTRRYRAELDDSHAAVEQLRELITAHAPAVLVYAAKAPVNNATVLRDYLAES